MGEIKKQSLSNFVFSYIGAALGFLTIYIQPNLISASDIGLMRLIYSFSWLAAIAMPFGMASITLRFFPKIKNAQNNHHGFFTVLILITSIGALIVSGILYLNKSAFINYYKKSADFSIYFDYAIAFAFILSFISVFTVYSNSLLKTTFTVILTDVFVRIGQLILVIVYHYHFINQEGLIIGYIGIFLSQLIILIIYLIKMNAVSLKVNWSFFLTLPLKDITLFGILMMFTAFASLGVKYIDQLIIGHFLSENLVGIYATSVMMCAIMEIPFNSLERIAQPKIAYAWNTNDVSEIEKIYEMSSRYMFFIGSLIFSILWASIDLVFLFLPAEYQQGKTTFYIVSISSLLNLITGVNSSVIIMSKKYFVTSFLLFVLLIISCFANYWLIPIVGITGAAIAMLLALGLFNLLKYIYIYYIFKMQPFTKHTFYILMCLLISICFILLLPSGLHPFFRSLFGCIFSVVVFSGMNVKFKTIEEVNKVFRRLNFIK